MKAWLCVFLVGCGQIAEIGPASPLEASSRVAHSLEFRLALTDAGFRTLRHSQRWDEGSEREDIYFDVFQGGQFTLKYRRDPLKVRIKSREGENEWQISHVVNRSIVPALDLPVGVAETEAWEGAFGNKDTRKLLELSQTFFHFLPEGGPALDEAAQSVLARWPKSEWEGPEILRRFQVAADRLIPAATNRKTRLKAAWKLDTGRLDVILGVTEAWNERGQRVLLYEVEAEPPGPVSPQDFAVALRRAGLLPSHVAGSSPDAFAYTANQLRGHP